MVSITTICVEDSNDNPPQCLLNPYVAGETEQFPMILLALSHMIPFPYYLLCNNTLPGVYELPLR